MGRKEKKTAGGEASAAVKRGRTVRFVKAGNDAAKWVRWLEENCLASAKASSVMEVRRTLWGRTALIVRSGQYSYLIAKTDDGRSLPWEGGHAD